MRMSKISSVLVTLLWAAFPAQSHEFWISPETYQIDSGQAIRADLRVGQNFNGSALSFIPNNFVRFELVVGNDAVAVDGRLGDRPALNMAAPGDGLVIAVHETTDSTLNYAEWAKFVTFVTHKAMDGALIQHKTRGLPDTGFQETYRRYAKSLIATGDGAGADRVVGLRTEIVAMANPYTDALNGVMPVRVLLDGAPRANAQVEVFAKAADGTVTVSTLRTDADGVAQVPVAPDTHYLLDAVTLEALPNDTPDDGPVWHTLWASLTFAVPAGAL